MYKKINKIESFGVFNDFVWDNSVIAKGTEPDEFKKLNIIYGRNYSGKTTLSRMFRAMELGRWPENYTAAKFSITDTADTQFNQSTHSIEENDCIRVYNKDFVSENLGFLTSDDGEIEPFAVLGTVNNKLAKIEKDLKDRLGSKDQETGLLGELKQADNEATTALLKVTSKKKDFEELRKKFASGTIKPNPLLGEYNYNISKLDKDIKDCEKDTKSHILNDEIKHQLESSINEPRRKDISTNEFDLSGLLSFVSRVNSALVEELAPDFTLAELVHNKALQRWAENGIELHKGKRSTCGFCGSDLPEDIWEKFDAHFNLESKRLKKTVKDLIDEAEHFSLKFEDVITYNIEETYESYRKTLSVFFEQVNTETENINAYIENVKNELGKKLDDVFSPRQLLPIFQSNLTGSIASLQAVEVEHNRHSEQLDRKKEEAQAQIKNNLIAQFISSADYFIRNQAAIDAQTRYDEVKMRCDLLAENVKEVEAQLEELLAERIDETHGAKIVSSYLSNFFGHNGLELVAVKGTKGTQFKVHRAKKLAHNLSEGECSLIAFCYFMARLRDVQSQEKNLIVWIDDPISSLDSNHVFFVFSLIEAELARPIKEDGKPKKYRYDQMFISTHNLEFLKFLKRLSVPMKKIEGKKDPIADSRYFMVERIKDESALKKMPQYLSKYITEFNYLFHQVHNCATKLQTDDNFESFYNFGNNLRKFLEAYLYFKYPSTRLSADQRIQMFFAPDTGAAALTGRVANEFSHLEEIFDRSMSPVDYDEIQKLARFVLKRIKEADIDQYASLLESIGKKLSEDNLEAAPEPA
ncbi:AAA family ATPase [Pseudovibrio denitrificans]|uniref:AAA family ATPase n=1 Tax=Pseudovibrio denitrificans TaxID=258256 RepID=UPI0039BF44EE